MVGLFAGWNVSTIAGAAGLMGVLGGSGGLAGLLYSTPTILWKAGITCRWLEAEETDRTKLTPGTWIELTGGKGYWKIKSDTEWDGASCYKY